MLLSSAVVSGDRLPVSVVVALSAVSGAVGGWMSARRGDIQTLDEQATHAISLGIFGAGVSTGLQFLTIHYFEISPDETIQWALVLSSGIVGLLGMGVVDEFTERVKTAIRTVRLATVGGWLRSILDALSTSKNDVDERDS